MAFHLTNILLLVGAVEYRFQHIAIRNLVWTSCSEVRIECHQWTYLGLGIGPSVMC